MSAQIIDGKALAAKIKDEIKEEVSKLDKKPGLAVVLVGEDPASQTYVNSKEKACEYVGFYSEVHRLPADTSEKELLALVQALNKNDKINGILVQLPLPDHMDEKKVTEAIDPQKDVDGFHPYNTGALLNGDYSVFLPCTPAGCLELIKSTGVDLVGKKAVIVGRSNIVGKPVAILLLKEHCTVEICHSRTQNLADEIKSADILIAAVGKAKLVTSEMIKPGAVVIDVGMNRDENNKLCGDVDFESVKEVAGHITPVPGGVGPMTITMLMKNTLKGLQG